MKKRIVTLTAGVMLATILMTGCGTDEAVASAQAQIEALGEISLDSETAINAAMEAYNALSDEQKAQVENSEVLTEAKNTLDGLKEKAEQERIEAEKKAEEEKQAALEQQVSDGVDYLRGTNGKEYNPDKALELFEEAAGSGSVDAAFLAGYTLDWEKNGGVDYADMPKALEYYEQAADSIPCAKICEGFIYKYGQGVDTDSTKAASLFSEAVSALDVDSLLSDDSLVYKVEVEYVFGVLLYYGDDTVSPDTTSGFKLMEAAADDGSLPAEWKVATLYKDGTEDIQADESKAFEYYKQYFEKMSQWADAGSAYAMKCVGDRYSDGCGVEVDSDKAIEWYTKAFEAGDAEAATLIADMYEKGYGVSQDYSKAFEWYQKSADAGDSLGMVSVGDFYEKGYGVSQDYSKAFEWYQKSADAGDALGMFSVGIYYETGRGNAVDIDFEKAIEWYQKAIKATNDEKIIGMFETCIGEVYEYGLNDVDTAIEHYKTAVSHGYEDSKRHLDRLGVVY